MRVVGLLVQGSTFAALAAAWSGAPVVPSAWLMLYAVAAIAALWPTRGAALRFSATGWLAVAGYCVLFAAMFWGANVGMDALHGAQRAKADVAGHLGGLELWFVLCPGLLSVALARAAMTHAAQRHLESHNDRMITREASP